LLDESTKAWPARRTKSSPGDAVCGIPVRGEAELRICLGVADRPTDALFFGF